MTVYNKTIFIYLLLTIPLSLLIWDIFNTLDDRAFLDGFLYTSNPYIDVRQNVQVIWQNYSWVIAWPYPPITIPLILPAWFIYKLTNQEYLFQIIFKLPQILSAIGVYYLLFNKYKNETLAKFWLLNPLVIALSIQGGFQHITAFLILLGVYFWQNNKLVYSFVVIALSASLRIYPAFLILPLILILLSQKKWKTALISILITSLIFILPYIPFIYRQPNEFINSFMQSQSTYLGPLGSWPIAHKIYQRFSYIFGYSQNYQPLYFSFSLISGLIVLYWFIYAYFRKINIIKTLAIGLGLFYLFYPKIHMGYDLPFMILGLIILFKSKISLWKNPIAYLWVPSLLFLLLVNGNFKANGVFYLLLPYTNFHYQIPYASLIHLTLSFSHVILFL